jgi:hypothetical protein
MAEPTPKPWWERSLRPCSHVPLESCYTSMRGGLIGDSFVCFINFLFATYMSFVLFILFY